MFANTNGQLRTNYILACLLITMLLSINHAERGFDYLMPWSLGCNFDSEGNLKEKQYDIQTDLLKYQLVLEKDINSQRRQSEILFPPSPPIYAKNEK